MPSLLIVLTFVVLLIFMYLVYTIANIAVTLIKTRKRDHSMHMCVTTSGRIFYIGLTVGFVLILAGCIASVVYGITHSRHYLFVTNGINVATVAAWIYSFQIANIVLVGKKQMLVGRLLIDYRKMKKVNISNNNELTFVFSQQNYRFNTRWVDIMDLKRAISRRS